MTRIINHNAYIIIVIKIPEIKFYINISSTQSQDNVEGVLLLRNPHQGPAGARQGEAGHDRQTTWCGG